MPDTEEMVRIINRMTELHAEIDAHRAKCDICLTKGECAKCKKLWSTIKALDARLESIRLL